MASYSTNEIRGGMKVLIDHAPYAVINNEFVKPGKGQAFSRIKMRNLKTQRVVEKTYKSGESIEKADVMDIEMSFLYREGDEWNFMNSKNYEQVNATTDIVGEAVRWIKENDDCLVTLWNDEPITVASPTFVFLKIIACEPGIKGDTVSGGSKVATLETNTEIRVPLFLNVGDVIKIDTRTAEYVSRSK
ncbi:MAG TPA: elongation factor P [Gammaproteobacteria bacterium]|nr:elongation factor P [Gammaproteobacteria bacterium]